MCSKQILVRWQSWVSGKDSERAFPNVVENASRTFFGPTSHAVELQRPPSDLRDSPSLATLLPVDLNRFPSFGSVGRMRSLDLSRTLVYYQWASNSLLWRFRRHPLLIGQAYDSEVAKLTIALSTPGV